VGRCAGKGERGGRNVRRRWIIAREKREKDCRFFVREGGLGGKKSVPQKSGEGREYPIPALDMNEKSNGAQEGWGEEKMGGLTRLPANGKSKVLKEEKRKKA